MNIAYRFRIYPNREQEVLLAKTFGCCRFLYNQMLNDKIQEYEKTKKMLKNTPAMYKKEYPFLKEVDSLALANVQLHLEKAYKNFFRDSKIGFPRFKSKHHSKNSYTTNVVNGNILVESKRIRLPKLKWIAMKKHREPAEGLRLKSVTVSMEPSGKYFASLLYEGYSCENQAADKDYSNAKILGIDYAMQGMAVFSEEIEMEEAGFFRKNEKRLAREQRKLSRCVKGSHNYVRQKKKVARCHEKIRSQRRDYLHKLSRRITDQYDIVAVEDIDMKAMSQCLHFGKSVQDNGYGMFRNMLDYKLAWKGKELVKIDRFFPSSKKCSKCGKIKKELKLSERVYRCSCGNEMDRDRNAAINIREEARDAVMGELRAHFRPEFLNRLDEIIMFKPLTKDNIAHITELMVADINRRLADRQLKIELTDAARDYVTEHGYDPQFGARPLRRFIQKNVETLVARIILEDKVQEGDTITLDLKGDRLDAEIHR